MVTEASEGPYRDRDRDGRRPSRPVPRTRGSDRAEPEHLRGYWQIAETVVRPELGKVKLSRLTARDLDRLYAKLTAKGNAAMTVRHVHAFIGVALRQAERRQLIDRNVTRQATPPAVHPTEVIAPSPDEVRSIIEAAEAIEPTFASLLLLAALTRCPRGELCGLRWPMSTGRRGASRRPVCIRATRWRMVRDSAKDAKGAPHRARRFRSGHSAQPSRPRPGSRR